VSTIEYREVVLLALTLKQVGKLQIRIGLCSVIKKITKVSFTLASLKRKKASTIIKARRNLSDLPIF
jgi:hypothetical protein